jgi:uncharacterized membrane protein YcaP (DUF421 family)
MLTDGWSQLGWTALKAFLLYLTALFLLRAGERRTLAELAPFDVVAMVALGAILGRTATASDTAYAVGAVALVTLVIAHRMVARVRMSRWTIFRRLLEHPPAVLVRDGVLRDDELRRCRLTPEDLYSALRRKGIADLSTVHFAIFEPEGRLSVVRVGEPDGDLVQAALREAARARGAVPDSTGGSGDARRRGSDRGR